MKHFLLFFLFIQISISYGQSKKVQIEILRSQFDSLNYVLTIERHENSEKDQENRIVVDRLKNQIAKIFGDFEIEKKKINNRMALLEKTNSNLEDSLNLFRKELAITKKWLEWNSGKFSDMHRNEIGNLIVLTQSETMYSGGEPNDDWNGDSYEDYSTLYLFNDEGRITTSNLEDCFNSKKQILLKEINLSAEKQFQSEYELVRECGGTLKTPYSFKELEMHCNEDEFCFSYDIGLWPGNLCGGPSSSVCFTKEYIRQFLK